MSFYNVNIDGMGKTMARKKIYLMVLCLLSNFLLSRCTMVGLGIGLVMQKNETLKIKPEDQDSGFLLAGQKLLEYRVDSQ